MSPFRLTIAHHTGAVTVKTVDAETWTDALELVGPIVRGVLGIKSLKLEVMSGFFQAVAPPVPTSEAGR